MTGDASPDEPEAVRCVFVYGTLRPGECNWHHLEGLAERTEPARLPGHRLYELEYPCAVGVAEAEAPADDAFVIGDLVWLLTTTLAQSLTHLDWFEDFRADDPDHSLYTRERCTVIVESGAQITSWVYVAGRPQLDRLTAEHEIPGGEWAGS